MTEQLASYDSTFFVESVDMLDWDRIALVVRASFNRPIH